MKEFFTKLFNWVIFVWIVGYLGYLIGNGIDLYKGRDFEISENFLIMTFSLLFLLFSLLGMKYAQRYEKEAKAEREALYGIDIAWRASFCDILRDIGRVQRSKRFDVRLLVIFLIKWRIYTEDIAINLEEQSWYIPLSFFTCRSEVFEPTSSLKYVLHRDLFGEVFASPKVRLRFLGELFPPQEFVEYLCKLEVAEQEKILEKLFGDEKVSIEDLK